MSITLKAARASLPTGWVIKSSDGEYRVTQTLEALAKEFPYASRNQLIGIAEDRAYYDSDMQSCMDHASHVANQ